MADREETDFFFGHPGFVGSEHPLADPDDEPLDLWDGEDDEREAA